MIRGFGGAGLIGTMRVCLNNVISMLIGKTLPGVPKKPAAGQFNAGVQPCIYPETV